MRPKNSSADQGRRGSCHYKCTFVCRNFLYIQSSVQFSSWYGFLRGFIQVQSRNMLLRVQGSPATGPMCIAGEIYPELRMRDFGVYVIGYRPYCAHNL